MWNATIVGRLTKDVEKVVYNAKSGAVLVRSTMAVNVGVNNETKEKEVNYIDIVAFGQVADFLASYGRKGNGFVMNGKMKQEKFKCNDGVIRSSLKMEVKECDIYSNLLANEVKKQQTANNNQPVNNVGEMPFPEANKEIQQAARHEQVFGDIDNQICINDDDLPF